MPCSVPHAAVCSVTTTGAALAAESARPPAAPKGWTTQFRARFPANRSSAGLLLDNAAEGEAKFAPLGCRALEEKLHDDTGLDVAWGVGAPGQWKGAWTEAAASQGQQVLQSLAIRESMSESMPFFWKHLHPGEAHQTLREPRLGEGAEGVLEGL